MTATRDALRYGFAVGKVRVLETRMLGRSGFERLLDASTFAEQKRILSDTPYGRFLDEAETSESVESGLASALDEWYRFLEKAELPVEVVSFFRVRHDFANLKAALKARLLGARLDGLLTGLGAIEQDRFSADLADLPGALGACAREVLKAAHIQEESAGGGASGYDVDESVDHALFAELSDLAARSGSDYLEGLTKMLVDVANVKIVVRGVRARMPRADIRSRLIVGGSVPIGRWAALLSGDATEVFSAARRLPVFRGVPADDVGTFGRIDVIADNVIVAYLRTARRVSVGPEPVIAYVLAREAEVVTVRTLLLGRLAGIDSETLRARLRDRYV